MASHTKKSGTAARKATPATPPRRAPSSRTRNEPPLSPDSDRAKDKFKDSPEKLSFFIDYSNAVTKGEIGTGKGSAKTTELGKKHKVANPKRYYFQLKKRVALTGRINRKKRKSDHSILSKNAKMFDALVEYAVAEKYQFTYRDAALHMRKVKGFKRGCSKSAIQRFITNPTSGWKIVSQGTVPLLSKKHKKDRLAYARDRLAEGDTRWIDHVEVDEKWFFGWSHGRKCKLPPGHKRPKKPLQHKSHIPKIMFLAATALPRPEHGFDGKIGFWRVQSPYTAKKRSVHHEKGDVYEKDVTLDSDKYYEMMTKLVFPAIRRKMPWAKEVTTQQDGATPHTGKDNVNRLNIAGAKKRKRRDGSTTKITVFTQAAQSPDTNINDLCVFPAMSRRFYKKQKHESISDLEQLAKNAKKTWKQFPEDELTKSWATKTLVCQAIVLAKGGNDFHMPHAKDADMEGFELAEMFEEEEEDFSEVETSEEEEEEEESSEEESSEEEDSD
jgi:hypothetical protein